MRILVIENDLVLLAILIDNLMTKYALDVTANLNKAQKLLSYNHYQLILFSGSLLRENQDFLQKLEIFNQQSAKILIMFDELSSFQNITCLTGINFDFIRKPFSLEELNSRLELLLFYQLERKKKLLSLKNQPQLDFHTQSLVFNQEKIILSKKEFSLLNLFMKRPNQILPRTLLACLIWENEEVVFGNSIEVHIATLRKKLRQLVAQELIQTIRGSGYIWRNFKEKDFKEIC